MAMNMDLMADALVQAVEPTLRAMRDRIAELEARQSEALRYGGTFNRAVQYERNTIVTHDGGLWLAIRETTGQRPSSGDDWVLISKARNT